MIDLRFVERSIVTDVHDANIPKCPGLTTGRIKKVKILQWRQCRNTLEVVNELQDVIWTEWEDVRIEEE